MNPPPPNSPVFLTAIVKPIPEIVAHWRQRARRYPVGTTLCIFGRKDLLPEVKGQVFCYLLVADEDAVLAAVEHCELLNLLLRMKIDITTIEPVAALEGVET